MSLRLRRLVEAWDGLRTSFGFLPGLTMVVGGLAALALPTLDRELGIDVPALSFDSQDSARTLLQTIATATVSVAGLSFSVTVVAFTLAASQLSPRVLRSFRGDRLSQATLAALLGTFFYCLVLLVRLGVSPEAAEPPNLSMTLAVVAGFSTFLLFAVFVAHIVFMLQPSSVIAAIHEDAGGVLESRYPSGPGEPDDPEAARVRLEQLDAEAGPAMAVAAASSGYLTLVETDRVIEAAAAADAVVFQVAELGGWVLPGEALARVRTTGGGPFEDDDGGLADAVRESFHLGKQRTMVQDIGFPVRQLADIALKGLSPGVNDPTTATNAIEQLTTILIEFARSSRPSPIRTDADGTPRFVADPPDLDELTGTAYGEARIFVSDQPALAERMLELLARLRTVAIEEGEPTAEIDLQSALLRENLGERARGASDRPFATSGQ